jgi:hypothetical protein
MKFNWVNLLATLLILGGVILLIERHFNGEPKRHIPTVEEAKADIERQIENKLGRPLSDAEVQMIDVTKSGDQISITLHQPLTGRVMRAIHDARAATQASMIRPPSAGTDSMAGGPMPPRTPPVAVPTTLPAAQ